MRRIIVTKKDCAKAANEAIMKWAKNKDKLIVAIDGYTGAGKTTLLDSLARMNPSVLPVNRDDFVISRAKVRALFLRTEEADRSALFEHDICNFSKLKHLISAFQRSAKSCTLSTYDQKSGRVDVRKRFDTTKNIMIIEGVFLFHPGHLNHCWDKRIYLDGDNEKIDRQRVRREKRKWGVDYFPETHPDSFVRHITVALKEYRRKYHPEKRADLTLYLI